MTSEARAAPSPGRWPYAAALKLIQWQARRWVHPQPQIWARNSYLTRAFVPFKSDLDLTVWFDEPPAAEARRRMSRILKRAKKVFPALGECNSYGGHGMDSLLPWANRFEARRDPEFLKRLGPAAPAPGQMVPERAERSVFLMRMLEADLKNLLRAPERRETKWRQHFEQCGLDCGPRTFLGMPPVEAILYMALGWLEETHSPEFFATVTAALEVYLRGAVLRSKIDHQIPINEIVACAMAHRFSFAREAWPRTRGPLCELALAQLAWEVFAMSSQFLFTPDVKPMVRHLRDLSRQALTAAEFNPLWAADLVSLGRVADGLAAHVSCQSGH